MERTPETSHGGSTGFKAPDGVTVNFIPPTTNIGEMMVKGELDATLLYLTHANLVDRSRIDLSNDKRFRPPVRPQDRRSALLRQDRHLPDQPRHGDPPLDLRALSVGGAQHLQRLRARRAPPSSRTRDNALHRHYEPGLIGDDVRKALATDTMAYGVTRNRKVLETITQYVHEQGSPRAAWRSRRCSRPARWISRRRKPIMLARTNVSLRRCRRRDLRAPARAPSRRTYPSHTIKVIVPTPAGGPVDTMARHRRQRAAADPRPAGGDREPRRRRQHDRLEGRGRRRSRRLHPDLHRRERPDHEPDPAQERRLYGGRFRAGRHPDRDAVGAGRASVGARPRRWRS